MHHSLQVQMRKITIPFIHVMWYMSVYINKNVNASEILVILMLMGVVHHITHQTKFFNTFIQSSFGH